jgi:nicotinamidase-related amidase
MPSNLPLPALAAYSDRTSNWEYGDMDALIIIDVQQGMFSLPDEQPYEGDPTVARIRTLLDRARAGGTPVFFVQHAGDPGDLLDPAGPGFAFRAELTPAAGESVTVKRFGSAFRGTDFDTKLRGAGIDHLVICGMQSEYCVDSAVRGASERGYRITLVADGHTTFDTKTLSAKDIIAHHNRTLGGDFATVVPAEAIQFGTGS